MRIRKIKIVCGCGWKGNENDLEYFNDTLLCPRCADPRNWELAKKDEGGG